jgi:leader peptidase (prepilin peptidase)/N-methyltransferase
MMISVIGVGVIVFIFGAVIGSFLNVVIYRIPNGESIVFPSSKCQSCQHSLKWYHNIPIFSWLFLGGKCAFCSDKIAKQYPIVEFITGLIFVALFFKMGLVWQLIFVFASFASLFALVMIDFKYRAVPDNVNFVAFIFALIPLIGGFFVDYDYLPLVYALSAPLGLYLIGLISSIVARKEAMGGADVIVAGTMGALLGFPNFFLALFLSAILSLIPALINRYLGDDEGVPFIPFLAMATFIVFLYDNEALKFIEMIIYG